MLLDDFEDITLAPFDCHFLRQVDQFGVSKLVLVKFLQHALPLVWGKIESLDACGRADVLLECFEAVLACVRVTPPESCGPCALRLRPVHLARLSCSLISQNLLDLLRKLLKNAQLFSFVLLLVEMLVEVAVGKGLVLLADEVNDEATLLEVAKGLPAADSKHVEGCVSLNLVIGVLYEGRWLK